MNKELAKAIVKAYMRLHENDLKNRSVIKTYLFPKTVNKVYGHDQGGYYVLERVSIHTDGKPDEFEKTYYIPAAVYDGFGIEGEIYLDEGEVLKMLEGGEGDERRN